LSRNIRRVEKSAVPALAIEEKKRRGEIPFVARAVEKVAALRTASRYHAPRRDRRGNEPDGEAKCAQRLRQADEVRQGDYQRAERQIADPAKPEPAAAAAENLDGFGSRQEKLLREKNYSPRENFRAHVTLPKPAGLLDCGRTLTTERGGSPMKRIADDGGV
jgi:hypothetical protein